MAIHMAPDSYEVEILHYLNPHLLWVEVKNFPNKKADEFYFEQIGVYGVLPQEISISIDTEDLETKRCEKWAPAAVVIMKKVFSEAEEVWFSPVYIDRRSSIFDDNIHKYGELFIKKQNGKIKSLSKLLAKSGFALHDACLFHQELSIGNIKTKLNTNQTKEVIKHIANPINQKAKDQWEKSFKKQTSIFRTAQNLESSLTIKNLERHNQVQKARNIIEHKIRDLDMCKDADEESVGRAMRRESKSPKQQSSLLKKLELTKTRNKTQVVDALTATKMFVEANARTLQDRTPSDNSLSMQKYEIDHNSNKDPTEESFKMDINKKPVKEDIKRDNTIKAAKEEINILKATNKKSPVKDPSPKQVSGMRLAYCPPGVDLHSIPIKVIPKNIEDDSELEPPGNVENEEVPYNYKEYDGVDSEVGFEIAKKDVSSEHHVPNIDNDVPKFKKVKDYNKDNTDSPSEPQVHSRALQKKLKMVKEKLSKSGDDSFTSSSDVANDSLKNEKQGCDSDGENVDDILEKIRLEYGSSIKSIKDKQDQQSNNFAINPVVVNVNPFKNVDSVFVDKLITPVLMVHTKMNKRIEPAFEMRDIHFNTHIHVVLKNMCVERPMMIQSISWCTILRGYSLFMVSPMGSGKTLGYIPAVCRLISDCKSDTVDSVGPSCIIVCATAKSVAEVEKLSKMLLGLEEKVLSCYTGMDELQLTTLLLNGCDLLICTPPILARVMQLTDFSVDLRRLSTFVLEDCERLSEVYMNEMKFFLIKIKEMMKTRVNKEMKVQFIAASRIWCDFMQSLARKAPNSVVCIGAFQECVLYSKTNMTVNFVKRQNKLNNVLECIEEIDGPKRTVIVCSSDDEVALLEKTLKKHNKVVFACDSSMTVEELYNLNKTWSGYQEPILGPILICCDGNLTHLNITNAHYLIHYSLPQLFSMFCKRFSVLNDNYPSIFKSDNENVKIKVLLEEGNVKQLPKILHFIKRCCNDVPKFLDDVCTDVLAEKDVMKAENFVPICDSLLALGECPDFWNCIQRHAVLEKYDEPKEWVPRNGTITFKILHYHTAATYSVRLLSNIVNGKVTKYPQTYSTLSLKLGMHYSKESNKKLHGIPKVGDVCAVSIKQNFYARCQVMKILNYYKNGNPNYVLIKLLDEEKMERTRDIYLYYLPEDLKKIETYVMQVRLANIKPKDKDITFSDLARDQLKKITDKQDLYLRGHITLTVGNCIFVNTLEACQDLTSLNETVVTDDFRKLLVTTHAITDLEHMVKLENLCRKGGVVVETPQVIIEVAKTREQLRPNWAHLDNDMSSVFFASAENPGTFFVRLTKFEDCMNILLKDIQKYAKENPDPVTNVTKGDIVLAKFPDDTTYERAKIDQVYDENRVKCFFVDQGDWRDVLTKDLIPIPDKFLTQMPCQAIECRLIGVSPAGDDWTEFGTNWFSDTCFEDSYGRLKQLYVKYFTKETAQHTGGHKYGVALIDTNGDNDVLINQLMIDVNLAQENLDEIKYFDRLELTKKPANSDLQTDDDDEWEKVSASEEKMSDLEKKNETQIVPLDKIFPKKPIRSVPLSEGNEKDGLWDVNMSDDFVKMFKSMVSDIQKPKTNSDVIQDPKTNSDVKKPSVKSLLAIKCKSNDDNSNKSKDVTQKSDTLDSDDLSSSECTQNTEKGPEKIELSIVSRENAKECDLRKPKLVWRQHNTSVSIKIQLLGVESYDMKIEDRNLKFQAIVNDLKYGFDIQLYGVVDTNKFSHANKGQYILVNLTKVLNKTWLTLTKDATIRKWIIYDADSIDTSSDEDEIDKETVAKVVNNAHYSDSGSDDDLLDDINFSYGVH